MIPPPGLRLPGRSPSQTIFSHRHDRQDRSSIFCWQRTSLHLSLCEAAAGKADARQDTAAQRPFSQRQVNALQAAQRRLGDRARYPRGSVQKCNRRSQQSLSVCVQVHQSAISTHLRHLHCLFCRGGAVADWSPCSRASPLLHMRASFI